MNWSDPSNAPIGIPVLCRIESTHGIIRHSVMQRLNAKLWQHTDDGLTLGEHLKVVGYMIIPKEDQL